jgi:LPS-assembly protein
MNRFPALPSSPRLLRIITAAFAAASVSLLASGQANAQSGGKDDPNAPTVVHAEQMTGRPDREVFLERDVEVTRGPTTVTSDKANYNIVDDRVEAFGNVCMRRSGDVYTGDELKLRIESGQGYVLNPAYRLGSNNANGKAERIDFEAQDRAKVIQGTYSTCEGPDPDWYLKSSTLDLDSGRNEGFSRNAVVYFKHVPILATPAMSFPLSDARRSGFLPPTIGTTSKGGMEVTVPYYWDIAPNRDLTLYPKIYARRGLQLGGDARYLGTNYLGETKFEALPNDQQTRASRYAIASTHTHAFAPGWSYAWNINAASDDNYPNDFPGSITGATQRLLLRDLNTTYASGHSVATARVSNYQILQDPAAPISRPYDRLPQLTYQYSRYDVNGFDGVVDSDFTRFWHPDLVRGDRVVVNPKISYPIIGLGYFMTPKLSLHATKYFLSNQVVGQPQDLTRVLPTLSLDSGLVFERDARLFDRSMTQTLEPRLFYVYTPYRDQNAFPLFDTGEADLSFAQLFSENRFVGSDRISDANQLTAAVVSRYLESTGAERVRVAVGQRFYFTEQRVTLGSVRNDSRSDVLLSAMGRLTRAFDVEGNVQYSQTTHVTSRASMGARWQPAPKRVLNLQYRRDLLNKLEQVDVSGQWPIAQRWYGVARVNYSLPDRTVAEGLFGVEYKADCWVFRIVGQRIPTSAQQASSAIFFQLELNGLTRLGSNPLDVLRSSIPGYQLVNQPSNLDEANYR